MRICVCGYVCECTYVYEFVCASDRSRLLMKKEGNRFTSEGDTSGETRG